MNSSATISGSFFASPGGSAARQCHCSVRPEFTSEPSSSAKQEEGRRKTSVWMRAGSTLFSSPCGCQKFEVSVTSGSMVTRNFSLESPSTSLSLCGIDASGLKPWHT